PGAEAFHGLPGLRGAWCAEAAGWHGAPTLRSRAAGSGPARALPAGPGPLPAGSRPPPGPGLAAFRHPVILPMAPVAFPRRHVSAKYTASFTPTVAGAHRMIPAG